MENIKVGMMVEVYNRSCKEAPKGFVGKVKAIREVPGTNKIVVLDNGTEDGVEVNADAVIPWLGGSKELSKIYNNINVCISDETEYLDIQRLKAYTTSNSTKDFLFFAAVMYAYGKVVGKREERKRRKRG